SQPGTRSGVIPQPLLPGLLDFYAGTSRLAPCQLPYPRSSSLASARSRHKSRVRVLVLPAYWREEQFRDSECACPGGKILPALQAKGQLMDGYLGLLDDVESL